MGNAQSTISRDRGNRSTRRLSKRQPANYAVVPRSSDPDDSVECSLLSVQLKSQPVPPRDGHPLPVSSPLPYLEESGNYAAPKLLPVVQDDASHIIPSQPARRLFRSKSLVSTPKKAKTPISRTGSVFRTPSRRPQSIRANSTSSVIVGTQPSSGIPDSFSLPRSRISAHTSLISCEVQRLKNWTEDRCPDVILTSTKSRRRQSLPARASTVATSREETTTMLPTPGKPTQTSLYTPMRRRSLMTPGVATRLSDSPLLLKSKIRQSLPPPPSHPISVDRTNLTKDISASYETDPANIQRVATPCEADYQQIGGYKSGTLRITNGSPAETPPDPTPKCPPKPSKWSLQIRESNFRPQHFSTAIPTFTNEHKPGQYLSSDDFKSRPLRSVDDSKWPPPSRENKSNPSPISTEVLVSVPREETLRSLSTPRVDDSGSPPVPGRASSGSPSLSPVDKPNIPPQDGENEHGSPSFCQEDGSKSPFIREGEARTPTEDSLIALLGPPVSLPGTCLSQITLDEPELCSSDPQTQNCQISCEKAECYSTGEAGLNRDDDHLKSDPSESHTQPAESFEWETGFSNEKEEQSESISSTSPHLGGLQPGSAENSSEDVESYHTMSRPDSRLREILALDPPSQPAPKTDSGYSSTVSFRSFPLVTKPQNISEVEYLFPESGSLPNDALSMQTVSIPSTMNKGRIGVESKYSDGPGLDTRKSDATCPPRRRKSLVHRAEKIRGIFKIPGRSKSLHSSPSSRNKRSDPPLVPPVPPVVQIKQVKRSSEVCTAPRPKPDTDDAISIDVDFKSIPAAIPGGERGPEATFSPSHSLKSPLIGQAVSVDWRSEAEVAIRSVNPDLYSKNTISDTPSQVLDKQQEWFTTSDSILLSAHDSPSETDRDTDGRFSTSTRSTVSTFSGTQSPLFLDTSVAGGIIRKSRTPPPVSMSTRGFASLQTGPSPTRARSSPANNTRSYEPDPDGRFKLYLGGRSSSTSRVHDSRRFMAPTSSHTGYTVSDVRNFESWTEPQIERSVSEQNSPGTEPQPVRHDVLPLLQTPSSWDNFYDKHLSSQSPYEMQNTESILTPTSQRRSVIVRTETGDFRRPNWTIQTDHEIAGLTQCMAWDNFFAEYLAGGPHPVARLRRRSSTGYQAPAAPELRHRASSDGMSYKHLETESRSYYQDNGPYPALRSIAGQKIVTDPLNGRAMPQLWGSNFRLPTTRPCGSTRRRTVSLHDSY